MKVSLYHLTLGLIFISSIDFRFFPNSEDVPSITSTEAAALALFCFFLGKLALEGNTKEHVFLRAYRENRVVFLYFAWALTASVAGLLVRQSTDALSAFKNLFPSFLIYLFVIFCINDMRRVKAALSAYLAGICANLAVGILQIFFGWPRFMKLTEAVSEKKDFEGSAIQIAATGIFNHPNGLAVMLIPAAILLIAILRYGYYKRALSNLTLLALLGLLFFVFLATYSKGAWFWVFVGLMVLFIPDFLQSWRFGLGLVILLGGITCVTIYSLFELSAGWEQGGTVLTRVLLWIAALDVIRGDYFVLVLGNGFDAMKMASSEIANWEYTNSHNSLLNQVLFYGAPALIMYIWLTFSALRRTATAMRDAHRESKIVARFLFAALIAVFGEYFFEPANVNLALQVNFFFLIALSSAIARPNFERLGFTQ